MAKENQQKSTEHNSKPDTPANQSKKATRLHNLVFSLLLPLQPMIVDISPQQQSSTLEQNTSSAPISNDNPSSSQEAHHLFLPQVEQVDILLDHQEKIYEAIKDYFPNLTQENLIVLTLDEAQQPQQEQSIESFAFWLKYFLPSYQRSREQQQEAENPQVYFADSAQKVIIDLTRLTEGATTSYDLDEQGQVETVKYYAHYANPTAIMAEFIHLVQAANEISNGTTVVAVEGVSNVTHFDLLTWWIAYNEAAIAHGTPENAIVMPINTIDALVYPNPSLEEFQKIMKDWLLELQVTLNKSEHIFYEYTQMSDLGVTEKYPLGMQLLEAYIGDRPREEYHQTIEEFSSLYATTALAHIITPDQAFEVGPYMRQGVDLNMSQASDSTLKAVQTWKEHNLLASPAQWQALLEEYSSINVPEKQLALHPVVFAKGADDGSTSKVEVMIAAVQKYTETKYYFYRELSKFDAPSATLSFQAENSDGELVWWHTPIELQRSLDELETFIYQAEIPNRVWIPTLIPNLVNLNGKQVVLSVNIDTIRLVPIANTEYVQFRHQTAPTVAESGVSTETSSEYPTATQGGAPEEVAATAAQAVDHSGLSPEGQASLDEMAEAAAQYDPSTRTYQSVDAQEVPESEPETPNGGETVVFANEKFAALPKTEELRQRLQAVLAKRGKK